MARNKNHWVKNTTKKYANVKLTTPRVSYKLMAVSESNCEELRRT